MTWWIWMLIGFAFLAVEMLIPGGIIMLFFGVSAMIVGVLVALGIGGPLWLQALLFSVMSIVSLLTLRGPILRRMHKANGSEAGVDSLIGEQAVLIDEIEVGGEGKAELRGTAWTARNVGDVPLSVGQTCTVKHVDGLKLYIR